MPETKKLLREMAETLGVLLQIVRDEQAKDTKRHLLSPEADARIAAMIEDGLRQANAIEPDSTIPEHQSPRGKEQGK